MKARISTEWLSGCSGCHVAMVDLHEKLLALMDDVVFVRLPVLVDEKGFPEADVGIVEGAVRSEHDRECLRKMRASVKTLVAFGSCAVYGGPSGMGWLYTRDQVLDAAYSKGPTNVPGQRPDADAVPLEESVVPIDEVVKVDVYLPGCPPHPAFIAGAVKQLLGDKEAAATGKPVCADCKRKMMKKTGVALKRGAVTAPDADVCFLSQGVVCMGSVTLNRCMAPCPEVGVACTGCNGPSVDIVSEPHLDIRTMLAKRMEMLTGIAADEVKHYIEEDAKTYYCYAMASPVIYKKPAVELREWADAKRPQSTE
ncbi:MAG: methyl viologen-reducing hydrogenase [Acidobacteria bacterium]|nr:methyl viologen-reducing hydrogenase [Acidobacteriota bacterium]